MIPHCKHDIQIPMIQSWWVKFFHSTIIHSICAKIRSTLKAAYISTRISCTIWYMNPKTGYIPSSFFNASWIGRLLCRCKCEAVSFLVRQLSEKSIACTVPKHYTMKCEIISNNIKNPMDNKFEKNSIDGNCTKLFNVIPHHRSSITVDHIVKCTHHWQSFQQIF